jgi:hypothetical protein
VFPRLEEVVSASDVKEYATLKSKADNVVRGQATPILLPTVELYPDAALGVAEVAVGDVVAVIGGYGLVAISGEWMVTEVAVSVDPAGAETVNVTVAPLGVFADA